MPLTLPEKFMWRARDLLFAPPHMGAAEEGPVLIAGLFRAASGLGRAVRGLADDFEEAGLDVVRFDLSAIFDQEDLPASPELITEPTGRAVRAVVLHVNAPETDRALLALRHFRWRGLKPRHQRIIGYWVWETTRAPEAWRTASRRLSEVWTPSQFSAEAIAKTSAAPVRVMPHSIRPPKNIGGLGDHLAAQLGVHDATLVCLTMADSQSSLYRKNPMGAIEAFQKGLQDKEDARLIVKLRHTDAQPTAFDDIKQAARTDPRIILIEQDLSETDQWALIEACDVFLSLHRSEGFGLPVAEAMALGKTVIATGWSGNMGFMTNANSIPVPFELEPVNDPTGRYASAPDSQWASPNIDEAGRQLRLIATDKAKQHSLGDAARNTIRAINTASLVKSLLSK